LSVWNEAVAPGTGETTALLKCGVLLMAIVVATRNSRSAEVFVKEFFLEGIGWLLLLFSVLDEAREIVLVFYKFV
jgi:hypothetical protein